MATQEDLTAFANKFGLYIDIRPCDKCLNPEIDSEHGFDCDEYKAIYEWVENRVRQQIAKEIMSKCVNATWVIIHDWGQFEVAGCPQETGEDGTLLACSHVEDANLVRGKG